MLRNGEDPMADGKYAKDGRGWAIGARCISPVKRRPKFGKLRMVHQFIPINDAILGMLVNTCGGKKVQMGSFIYKGFQIQYTQLISNVSSDQETTDISNAPLITTFKNVPIRKVQGRERERERFCFHGRGFEG